MRGGVQTTHVGYIACPAQLAEQLCGKATRPTRQQVYLIAGGVKGLEKELGIGVGGDGEGGFVPCKRTSLRCTGNVRQHRHGGVRASGDWWESISIGSIIMLMTEERVGGSEAEKHV